MLLSTVSSTIASQHEGIASNVSLEVADLAQSLAGLLVGGLDEAAKAILRKHRARRDGSMAPQRRRRPLAGRLALPDCRAHGCVRRDQLQRSDVRPTICDPTGEPRGSHPALGRPRRLARGVHGRRS